MHTPRTPAWKHRGRTWCLVVSAVRPLMSSGCRAALLAAAARAKRVPTPTGGSRAAIAAIFRQTADGADEVLFIRRQERDGDPWSGHVAMPGGKQEGADADDEYTAMREAHEEVGLDLSDATIYQRFGRLVDDRIVQSRGRSMVTGMFGFAVKGTNSCPLLAPQADEVPYVGFETSEVLTPMRIPHRTAQILNFERCTGLWRARVRRLRIVGT